MPDNFFMTAERMHDSSKNLHSATHYHNACYLAGYVMECYGKILVQKAVIRNPKMYSHNVVNINTDLIAYLASSSASTAFWRKYIIDISLECPAMLRGWNPNHRYEDAILWNDHASENYQKEQEKCFEKIIEMHLDGLI
jgi:hypothetical protein